MEIRKNMAIVMRALKKESGKSMEEFAKELDISRSALQEYLSGDGNPSADTIDHLAQRLGVDSSFLVSGIFEQDQLNVLLKLLDTLKLLAELSPEKRLRFAELLYKMVMLWNKDGNHD